MQITRDPKDSTKKTDEKYVSRCIQLARGDLGNTLPNPSVGSVIVHSGKIIGEGYTSRYGGPHAEVNAIQSVKDKALLTEATLYVTLEPCSHFGKTPPCADLIIKHKIPKVVIGIKDPHEKVAGKGIEKLKKSGCSVTVGVLEKECRELHKRFLTFHQKKRPYIILKWAETIDGFLAPPQENRNKDPEPFWITNKLSQQLVHKWRSEEQAILVGTRTILEDNPKLTLRHWKGNSPSRIVLDRELKIDKNFSIMDGSLKTIVFTEVKNHSDLDNIIYEGIDFSQEIVAQICKVLYKYQLQSIMVEGGTKTLQSFIDSKLWDEARVFTGNAVFKSGVKAPGITGALVRRQNIQNDILHIFKNDQEHYI